MASLVYITRQEEVQLRITQKNPLLRALDLTPLCVDNSIAKILGNDIAPFSLITLFPCIILVYITRQEEVQLRITQKNPLLRALDLTPFCVDNSMAKILGNDIAPFRLITPFPCILSTLSGLESIKFWVKLRYNSIDSSQKTAVP